jgi:hypothetical protein
LCVAGKAQKSKKRLKNKQNREKKTLFSRPHVCRFIYAEQQKENDRSQQNMLSIVFFFLFLVFALLFPIFVPFLSSYFVYLPFISSSIGLPALDDATAATLLLLLLF